MSIHTQHLLRLRKQKLDKGGDDGEQKEPKSRAGKWF